MYGLSLLCLSLKCTDFLLTSRKLSLFIPLTQRFGTGPGKEHFRNQRRIESPNLDVRVGIFNTERRFLNHFSALNSDKSHPSSNNGGTIWKALKKRGRKNLMIFFLWKSNLEEEKYVTFLAVFSILTWFSLS